MPLDIVLAVLGGTALLARVGFALYAAGLVRSKNSAGMVLRLLCDLCLVVLVFWACGAAILFQRHNHYFSADSRFFFSNPSTYVGFILFQGVMFLMATGAVAGATAERIRFFPLCAASILLAGFLLPVAGNWAWFGWLARRGFLDVAGGTALHVSAGVCALVAAILVGPRVGKFNRDGSSSMIPGHNLPLAGVGVLALAVGWLAYISGAGLMSAIQGHAMPFVGSSGDVSSLAAFHALLSAAAAGFVAILVGQFRYGKPDIGLALMGFVGGLVAIAAGAGIVGAPGAVAIGAVTGLIIPLASVAIDLRLRVDDPAGVIAVHLLGGIWGTFATGLFAPPLAKTRLQQIGIQVVGIVTIAALAALVSLLFFGALKAFVGLRAREADEFDGLDLAEHDIGAYPDFQQTMIKSYHLREV